MFRTLWPLAWRLMLAVSLVAGPWPPAAWAGVLRHDEPVQTEAAPPCHGDTAAAAGVDHDESDGCDDGCCPDRDCDPARCLLLHAVALPPAVAFASANVVGEPVRGLDERATRGPPPSAELRPPIR